MERRSDYGKRCAGIESRSEDLTHSWRRSQESVVGSASKLRQQIRRQGSVVAASADLLELLDGRTEVAASFSQVIRLPEFLRCCKVAFGSLKGLVCERCRSRSRPPVSIVASWFAGEGVEADSVLARFHGYEVNHFKPAVVLRKKGIDRW
ncbi:MAG: hypothetical protein AAF604_11545 [Acidobacteriota bacterium]